jgi:hypothetical protein
MQLFNYLLAISKILCKFALSKKKLKIYVKA